MTLMLCQGNISDIRGLQKFNATPVNKTEKKAEKKTTNWKLGSILLALPFKVGY